MKNCYKYSVLISSCVKLVSINTIKITKKKQLRKTDLQLIKLIQIYLFL